RHGEPVYRRSARTHRRPARGPPGGPDGVTSPDGQPDRRAARDGLPGEALMAHQPRMQNPPGSATAQAFGLMLIRIAAGIYLCSMGVSKARWLLDSTPLANQLSIWSAQATPLSQWYLERLLPGTPVFARLVPLAEMAGGLALTVGF